MGVPEELIKLFHTLSHGSTVRAVTAHGPTPRIRLHRGLRQGYVAAIAQCLADMGLFLNVGKRAYATTTRTSIMVHLESNNAVTPCVRLVAKSTVPYSGLRLDPKGMASKKQTHVLRCEALLGWCKNTLGPASVRHEVMAAVVGVIVRYAIRIRHCGGSGEVKCCHQDCSPAI